MHRAARTLAILFVVLGLTARLAEIHAHEAAAHTESCAVCRVLQTPSAPPPARFEPRPIDAPEIEVLGTSSIAAPEPPCHAAHPLRAPPRTSVR
jgi:hypothetical protein